MTMKTPADTDANKLLTLALAARVPVIHVKTDELLHVKEILEHLNGGPVHVQANPLALMEGDLKPQVYLTPNDDCTAKLYMALKNAKATLVYANTKVHPLHLQVPQMVAPLHMVQKELAEHSSLAEELLPAVGGLTLKDVFEVSRITVKRDQSLSNYGLSKTRQSYPNKLKGLSQVDTAFDYYAPPDALEAIVHGALKFFHADAPLCTLAPRGLLLDGPPGTGKTMGAKYLADKLGVPLYRLDVSGLKGKYVGDSEGALQSALAQLDQCSPCVVLIDEVEKLFQRNTSNGDSGVTLGLLGSMLWWLQEHTSKVLTIMTTNNSKNLPPELYREGRVTASLTFMGLENIDDASAFIERVLEAQEEKYGDLTDKERETVRHRACTDAARVLDDGPISHAKATQAVIDAVTNVLVTRHNN